MCLHRTHHLQLFIFLNADDPQNWHLSRASEVNVSKLPQLQMFILDTFARVFICMFKASSVSILKKRKRNKYVATQCPFLEAIKYIFFFNNSLQHANSCKCLQWRTRTFSWKTFKCSSGGFCEASLWQVSPHGSRGGGGTLSQSAAFIATRADRGTISAQLITENHASMTRCGC